MKDPSFLSKRKKTVYGNLRDICIKSRHILICWRD